VLELVQVLVGDDQPQLVFSRLVEQLADAFIKIVLGLVDVEVRCRPPGRWDGGVFLRRLGNEGDEKAAENCT
jgi:hypothetical protein